MVAVSVDMLTTGFDCREVLHIVLCRKIFSPILYQQIRGRGTRTAPHIGKKQFVIYDFFRNHQYFNDDGADITVTVQGPADEFAQGKGITFSSSPPYSQEQIVGLLIDASLFGAVNFAQQSNGTTLRGAPGESNALLPPGVTPYETGVINFNQEAFSILNGSASWPRSSGSSSTRST